MDAMARERLDEDEIARRTAGLHGGWTGDPQHLTRSIEFADFLTAVDFVNRLAPRCEELDHHPDLALRWRWVDISLSTHRAGGVTALDFQLAQIIDELAAELPQAQ
jgi:4a-hydroxytetrahydrobiopterin dehydratase